MHYDKSDNKKSIYIALVRFYHLTTIYICFTIITMKKCAFLILSFALLFFPSLGKADLCAYLDKSTFDKAYDILSKTTDYIEYCPLCDYATANSHTIQQLTFMQPDDNTYEIYINNTPVDIAYIYIDEKNLGVEADCVEIYKIPDIIDILNVPPPINR